MRALVTCVVHDPRDARVYARQIRAMLNAGWEVTYVAPFAAFGVHDLPGVVAVDIPAARGRRRLSAIRAARRELRRRAKDHDVVVLHSPELMLAAGDLDHPCIVWDVHEDTAAAMTLKGWMPAPLRRPMARAVRRAERWAERHWHLILAEDAYARRFNRSHPIVPNSTWVPTTVPPTGSERAVYVGHVTRARGGMELIEVGRRIRDVAILHVVGHADTEMSSAMQRAHDEGDLVWHGFLPNLEALDIVRGSVAGLSLLHDEPNYRHSRPTKVMEYWAQGVPVVSTPLPLARDMVDACQGGILVDFQDAKAAADAVMHLAGEPRLRQRMADQGRAWVSANADWNIDGPRFVSVLAAWAGDSGVTEKAAGHSS